MMSHNQKLKKLFPPHTLRNRFVKKIARKLRLLSPHHVDIRYLEWIEGVEPLCWSPTIDDGYLPLISIVVPVFNVEETFLREMVFSVVNQTYGNWELILINASSNKKRCDYTVWCEGIDDRIKVISISNLGIAGNTNEGIKQSRGEYVALLDHDDLLAPEALNEVMSSLQLNPRPQLIYSDEDKMNAVTEQRFDPHFKSDWSIHLMRQVNYLNHLTVIEKKLIDSIGGYRMGFDGAQDYDFYLRLIDKKPVIYHIPKVLYHWRAAKSSTAADFSNKKNVLEAGIGALRDHLKRNQLEARVTSLIDQPGYYEVKYSAKSKVAIVIMASQSANYYAEYVRLFVKTQLKSIGSDVEIYSNNLKANTAYLTKHKMNLSNIVSDNSTEYVGSVLKKSQAETFILIDAAILPKEKNWMNDIAGMSQQCDDIAIVSPILVDKSTDTIIDAGYLRQGKELIPLFRGYPVKSHSPFGSALFTRSVDQISGRVMVASRSVVEKYMLPNKFNTSLICDNILTDNLKIIIRTQSVFNYFGDMNYKTVKSSNFSPSLTGVRYELGLPSLIRVSKSGEDNA
jgi:glycosyltransferase involved in cell wall biosynthesis